MTVDTTRAFRRPHDLRALVQAVVDGEIGSETDWIEWKGTVALGDRRSAGVIARHLLGFANRDPGSAANWAEGCAYFVAGAERGSVRGVSEVDPATLDARLTKYCGDLGPQFSLQYVAVSEVAVLVIVVEPPRAGDPIYTLRQNFEDPERKAGYSEGEIFVRRRGRTEKASSSDVARLTSRASAMTHVRGIELVVSADTPELTTIDLSASALDRYITKLRESYRLPTPVVTDEVARDRIFADYARRMTEAMRIGAVEDRTRDQFQEEVDAYLRQARAAMRGHVTRGAVRQGFGEVSFVLENGTEDNYADVAVEFAVEGEVSGYFDWRDVPDNFPAPPRPWGTPRALVADLSYLAPSILPRGVNAVPPGWTRNGGSTFVEYRAVHLRPLGRVQLPPVYLIAESNLAGSPVSVQWSATATNASGLARGTLWLPVAPSAVDLEKILTRET